MIVSQLPKIEKEHSHKRKAIQRSKDDLPKNLKLIEMWNEEAGVVF